MGNLSEHFNQRDFVCPCVRCGGKEYKIHLGLVGILEQLSEHFRAPIKIVHAFRCEEENDKEGKSQKSFHTYGKAAHLIVNGVSPKHVIDYLETLPDVHGIGFNVDDNSIHIDTRREERAMWVRDGKNHYLPLTPEKKQQYGLA